MGDDRGRAHAVADRVLHAAVGRAGGRQPGLGLLVVLEGQPETAVPLGIVQPRQSPVELCPQELLAGVRRRRQVGQ